MGTYPFPPVPHLPVQQGKLPEIHEKWIPMNDRPRRPIRGGNQLET